MVKVTHTSKRYGKGSTGIHSAVPPQLSDGRSGGVPRRKYTPPMRKPAVLATMLPEPSQGTPGTAISAVIYHPGPALPRQQRGDIGVELIQMSGWRMLVKRAKAKVTQWQAQVRRYFLKRMHKHVALTTRHAFGYVRLIAFIIRIPRRILFRKPALPYGAITQVVHDRRFALFRRRAVWTISGNRLYNPIFTLGPCWGTAAQSAADRLTNFFNKYRIKMKNFTKIGLSAVAAFALMFTTTIGVVAQEKVVASDNVEVKESVEGKSLSILTSVSQIAPNKVLGESRLVKEENYQQQDTYFEFIGAPGEEDDPTKWIESTDGAGCPDGDTQACKVLIRGSYLLPTSPLTINPSLLPSGRMPVLNTEGDFHVPDPAAAGTGTEQPYASTLEIYNKTVEP